MFGLTRLEIEAISKASGLKPRQFMESDLITPQFEKQLEQIHPVFSQTIPQRKRMRLRVIRSGRCLFLGARGCRLPTSGRPLYCRLYPFWFTPDDRLMVASQRGLSGPGGSGFLARGAGPAGSPGGRPARSFRKAS